MGKLHNLKTMKYTPMPAPQKVRHPANRFICEISKDKRITEIEIKSHMTIVHGRAKRGLTDMRQGQIQRAASVALSPPKKKIILTKTEKAQYLEKKDNTVKSL